MADKLSKNDFPAGSLAGESILPLNFRGIVREDVFISYEGVVCIPGVAYMHPEAFRDLMGEDEYQELLSRPRRPSEYTNCDCPGCKRAEKMRPDNG
jgi:hypothetical protein